MLCQHYHTRQRVFIGDMETESLQHHRQSAQHVHRPDLCYTLQNCLSLDVIQPAVVVRVSNKRDSLLLFLVFCFF